MDRKGNRQRNPIDLKRESGGMADIGSLEDGAIIDTAKIGERLIIIKEKSIYELMFADVVDPNRTNIDLPDTIQKLVINQGTESEMVSRVFLTAKTLFRKEFFADDIDITRALTLSLDILQEVSILEKEINEYLTKEQDVIEEHESKKKQPVSYSIPSISDIETRCKTIFQKADHIEQVLMEIVTTFYPNDGLIKQSHFPKFHEVMKNKYGEDTSFPKFIFSTLDFMKLVRNARNALDHRVKTVKVYDFELQANSDIFSPSIELDHRGSKLERQPLSDLLQEIVPTLIYIFEGTIAHISNLKVVPSFTATCVRMIPEDKRRLKHVRYSFWAPIGEGGYYNQ